MSTLMITKYYCALRKYHGNTFWILKAVNLKYPQPSMLGVLNSIQKF